MCGTTTVETRSATTNRGTSSGRGETTKGEDADSIANQNRSKGKSEGEDIRTAMRRLAGQPEPQTTPEPDRKAGEPEPPAKPATIVI